MSELIVVPLLAEYTLGPGGLSVEECDDLVAAALANEDTKDDYSVRALIHLAVEAPFVVWIRKELHQICQ